MQFAVRALGAENLMVQLTVDAADEADARHQVESRGMVPASVRRAGSGLSLSLPRGRGGRNRFSLVLFSQELLALLRAGLGAVEAIEALLEKEGSDAVREVLRRLLSGLRDGKRLSAVLAEQPSHFPSLYVGMMRAAEGTSDLPIALERFIQYQEQIDRVRNKIVSAAIYPAILLLVGGIVSLFLIGYVVPRFADVYQGAGRDLPWMSRLLLDFGLLLSHHTLAVLLALAGVLAAAVLAYHRLSDGRGPVGLLRHVPGMRERLLIFELSRLYRTLGMLNEGGIPIVQALRMVGTVVSAGINAGLDAATAMIEAGTPLSSAFESCGLTTPISVRMVRVGERTGELGSMLSQSAAFYDEETSRWIDRFTRALEPALMAVIGGVVGLIVVLLYMPIFDLAGSFQ